MYRYILFDLDGTISDPKVGICTSFQYALSKMGIDEPDIDKLEPVIGPPLRDSFKDLYGMSDEDAEKATAFYRERFSDVGKFENEIYPGIPELLRDLKKKGRTVAIASSKPTVFVEDILKHFEIREYFDVVVGSELDGTRDKKEDVIAEAIKQMFGDGEPDYDDIVMVGDRKYDIEAALNAGVLNIGVTYGYGSRAELEEAGADKIVNTVEGLRRTLIPPMGFSDAPARTWDNTLRNGDAGTGAGTGNAGAGNAGGNTAKTTPKSLEELKQMRKDIGRKSFGETWGFAGPALIYWLGKNAFLFGIAFLVSITWVKNNPNVELPAYFTPIHYGLAYGLACLFLIKDFKNVSAEVKEKATGLPKMKYVYIAFAASAVLAFGFGCLLKFINTLQPVADPSANAADTASQAADAASQVAESAAAEAAAMPPFIVSFLILGLLAPAASHFVFTGICYNRAKKFMKGSFALVISVMLCMLLDRGFSTGFFVAVLMGISMYIYDKSENYLIAFGSFIASTLIVAAIGFAEFNNALIDNVRVSLIVILIGATVMIAANILEKKENENA